MHLYIHYPGILFMGCHTFQRISPIGRESSWTRAKPVRWFRYRWYQKTNYHPDRDIK